MCYILLGGRLIERYSKWPHFISTAPDIAYAYVDDYRRLRPDVTAYGETLEVVARRRGLDAQRLRAAVDESGSGLRSEGTDTVPDASPHRSSSSRTPTGGTTALPANGAPPPLSGPWLLLGPAKAYFTTTEGGAAVSQRLEVLDTEGEPIPGLFAAGQNGLGGMVLWGHGLHIAWALTNGRLAGEAVMGAA